MPSVTPDISNAPKQDVTAGVAEKRAERWLQENKAALESSNDYVEKHGLPLSRYGLGA